MITQMAFMDPGKLMFLWLVPILVAFYIGLLFVRRQRNHRPERGALAKYLPQERWWKKHVAVILAIASLTTLIMAYARPKGIAKEPRDRATVVVVVDVSKSMEATDVAPSRIKALKESAKEFVDMLPTGFNVSLVAFAGSASLLVPPTIDRGQVKATIDALELAASTAIGEGIYTGLDSLSLVPPDLKHPDEPAPAAMVLLSDGETNLGRPSLGAAKKAKQMRCPIYTIAFGTTHGYIEDENGRRTQVRVNYSELNDIADASGGRRFDADSAGALKDAYSRISKSVGFVDVDKEITSRFILWGLLCGVLASLGVVSLAARWP